MSELTTQQRIDAEERKRKLEEWKAWHATWTAEDEELLKRVSEEFEAKRAAAAAAKLAVENGDGDTIAIMPLNCPMCKRVFTGHKRECVARFQLPSPQSLSTLPTVRCDCEMTSCGDVVLPYCLAPCGHSVCWDCLLCGNGECVICCAAVSGIVLNAGFCQLYGDGDADADVRCSSHGVHDVGNPIEYLCVSDNSLLCSKCVVDSHTGADHNVLKMCTCDGASSGHSDACGMSLLSSQASSLCDELKAALKRAQSTLSSAEEKREAMLERKSSLLEGCEKRMDDLISLIEGYKAKVIGELTAGFEEGLGLLTAKIDLLSTNVAQLGAAVTMHNHSHGLSLLGTLSSLKAMQGLVDSVKSCGDWVSSVPSSSTCTLIDSVSLTGCVESALGSMSVVVKDESYDGIDSVIVPGLASLKANVERAGEKWQLIRSLKRLRYHHHNNSEGDASSEGNPSLRDVLATAFQAVSAILASNSHGELKMSCDDDELCVALCEAVVGLYVGVHESDDGAVVVDWSVFGDDVRLADVAALLLKLMSSHHGDVERRLVRSCAATALCSVIRTMTNIDELRVLFQPEHVCVWVEDSRLAQAVVAVLGQALSGRSAVKTGDTDAEEFEAAVRKIWLPFVSGLFKIAHAHADLAPESVSNILLISKLCKDVNVIGMVDDADGVLTLVTPLLSKSDPAITMDVLSVSNCLLNASANDCDGRASSLVAVMDVLESCWVEGELMFELALQCLSSVGDWSPMAAKLSSQQRLWLTFLLGKVLTPHKLCQQHVVAVVTILHNILTKQCIGIIETDLVKAVWLERIIGSHVLVDLVSQCMSESQYVQSLAWNMVVEVLVLMPRSQTVVADSRSELLEQLLSIIDCQLKNASVQRAWLGCDIVFVLGIENCLPRITAAMGAHMDDAELQSRACDAFRNLASTGNDDNKVRIIAEGGLVRIFAAMDAHVGCVDVQESACDALRILAVHIDNKRRIVVEGGLTRLFAAMSVHLNNAGVQNVACSALLNLALNADNRARIVGEGGLVRLFAAMGAHIDNVDVLKFGCGAIRHIAVNDDNKVRIVGEGGLARLFAAMDGHVGNGDVQSYACGALWNLAANIHNRVRIAAEGGLSQLFAAMDAHVGNAELQRNACGALGNLAMYYDNRVRILAEGGLTRLFAAMDGHVGNAGVQAAACCALVYLAVNDDNKARIAAEGGMTRLFAAMDGHVGNADVQKVACSALWNLAMYDDNAVTIVAEGGLARLFAAMDSHVGDAGMQENVFGALWNLCDRSTANCMEVVKRGGIAHACTAMSNHADSSGVQYSSIGFLWTIAVDTSTAPRMITTMEHTFFEGAEGEPDFIRGPIDISSIGPNRTEHLQAIVDAGDLITRAVERHTSAPSIQQLGRDLLRRLTDTLVGK